MKLTRLIAVILTAAVVAPAWAANPTAVDVEITDGESSAYVLYSDGLIQVTGHALLYGYPSNGTAVDLELTSSGKGYWVLEKSGTVDSFGDAQVIASPVQTSKNFVDMEIFPSTDSPYFLLEDGSILTAGESIFRGELVRTANAVDLKLTSDGLGYYVLYADGLIAFFGTAIDRGYTLTGKTQAVALEVEDDGYYVLLKDGTLLTFGDVLPMPFTTLPSDACTDMVLTAEGYRVLMSTGEVQNFIQVDSQGTSGWYAQVQARSFVPQATNTPTPTPTKTPKPTTSYFSFTGQGYSEKIIGKIPDDAYLPSNLDSGHTCLTGGGLFVAASDAEDQPARKILFYSLTDSTSSSYTGAVFASLTTERGSAIIRGLAYSRAGLYVTVEDASGIFIFLITGNFESSTVSGFTMY